MSRYEQRERGLSNWWHNTLTSRGRAVAGAAGAVILAAAASFAVVEAASGSTPTTPVCEFVVQPGDTMWGVANVITGYHRDTRLVVAELEAIPGNPSESALQPGELVLNQDLCTQARQNHVPTAKLDN